MCDNKPYRRRYSRLRKSVYTLVLLYATLFAFFPTCSAWADSTNSISDTRPLTVAYCEYMPFYFKGLNGQPRGILVDIWERWSDKTAVPVEFKLLTWEEAMETTASGRVDINALMYRSPEREQQYIFSNPILNLSTYIYVHKNVWKRVPTGGIRSIEDIREFSVGVVAKDYSRTFLNQQIPGLEPKVYKDHETLVKAALEGQVDVFLMEGPVASTYMAMHNSSGMVEPLKDPIYTKPLSAGVGAGNPGLIRLVNKGLSMIPPEEIQEIIQSWTGNARPSVYPPYADTVTIAASIDNMPFHFADDTGRAVGYFIDLWRLWSEKTGIEVRFVTAPWAESLSMVKSGRADIHAGCFFSVQRDTFLDYAGVLSDCETHFFFHDSIFGLKNLEDLKGFQIGILDQDYALEFVTRELPDAAIRKYNSHKDLFDGIARGDVRVFICDTPTALYFLEKMNLLSRFRYHAAHPLYRKPFYSAVREGNTILVEQVNKGLEMISTAERAAIERKWMGQPGPAKASMIIVAAIQSFPPFSLLSAEGQPTGLIIDMWETWSKQSGKPVAFRMYDHESGVHALKDGMVDVLAFSPPQSSVSGWTQDTAAYYGLDWYMYRLRQTGSDMPDEPDESLVLGVLKGSRAEEWLAGQHPVTRRVPLDTTRQMILSAASGQIDGFLALPQAMHVLPDQLGLPGKFIQSSSPWFQETLGGVVRNFDPSLVQTINEGFAAIEHEEKIRIEDRWVKGDLARVFKPRSDLVLLTRDEQAWLTRHQNDLHPVRLAIDPDWPPFEFMETGNAFNGLVSDYVKLLNQKLGLNMAITQAMPLLAGDAAPKLSGIDLIPSAASFLPPIPGMIRTNAYLEFPWVIVNKQPNPVIGGIRDFYDKTVAVVGGYQIREMIQQDHPKIRLLKVNTVDEGLTAVLTDQAQGYIENLAIAGYQIQARNLHGLKVGAVTELPDMGIRLSVRDDWPLFVDILNKGIDSISDQEHDRIRQKWFSVRFEHQVDAAYIRKLSLRVGVAVVCLIGLFFVWNRQIQKRKKTAEQENQRKSEFLASLSHEIRTPLNAILGMTEMTLRSGLTTRQEQNLSSVKDSTLHLLDVITDILDFSVIEAGKMGVHERVFNLSEFLSRIERTWRFLAREKNLAFQMISAKDLPKAVRSDPVRLQQILGNLISNAVKFTQSGKVSVTVTSEAGITEGSLQKEETESIDLVFSIEDTGIGISRDQQEQIFERFIQAKPPVSQRLGGTGLGLSISREAARLLGGRLSLESEEGKGSCFTLRVPAVVACMQDPGLSKGLNRHASKETMGNHNQAPSLAMGQGLTLLLAEDDPMNARVFKSFLESTDHRVIHAEDGQKALGILKAQPVDMVFMDLEMPEMDGISTCRAIRRGDAGESNTRIPVIALSAHVLDTYKEESRLAGMNDFIPKPVDIEQLFDIIERFKPLVPASSGPDPDKFDPLEVSLAPLYDRTKTLASLGGNETLLARVLDIFIEETPGQLEKLKQASAGNNLEETGRLAHTLKGAASRVFAGPCVQQAAKLESLCRQGRISEVHGAVRELERSFQDLLNALSGDQNHEDTTLT